jgi:hypothetical protein
MWACEPAPLFLIFLRAVIYLFDITFERMSSLKQLHEQESPDAEVLQQKDNGEDSKVELAEGYEALIQGMQKSILLLDDL